MTGSMRYLTVAGSIRYLRLAGSMKYLRVTGSMSYLRAAGRQPVDSQIEFEPGIRRKAQAGS